jgi:hypothetical protein
MFEIISLLIIIYLSIGFFIGFGIWRETKVSGLFAYDKTNFIKQMLIVLLVIIIWPYIIFSALI